MARAKAAVPARTAGVAPQARTARQIEAVSDSVKQLSKEVKSLTKDVKALTRTLSASQKNMTAMKKRTDTIAKTMVQVRGQPRKIQVLENRTQKILAGTKESKAQARALTKIDARAARLEGRLDKVAKSMPKAGLQRHVADNARAVRENTRAVAKTARRIDRMDKQMDIIRDKTRSITMLEGRIDDVKKGAITGDEAADIRAGRQEVTSISSTMGELGSEVARLGNMLDAISARTGGVEGIQATVDMLKGRLEKMAGSDAVSAISEEIDKMRSHVGTISQNAADIESKIRLLADKASSSATGGIKSVIADIDGLKQDIVTQERKSREKASALADTIKGADGTSSGRDAALLRLAEFQSYVGIKSGSKDGTIQEIKSMAEQTRDIAGLFGDVSGRAGGIGTPVKVQQWAVASMLDCADRWELRFGEVADVLYDTMGRDALREAVSMTQVRDIYGIRGVDELGRILQAP